MSFIEMENKSLLKTLKIQGQIYGWEAWGVNKHIVLLHKSCYKFRNENIDILLDRPIQSTSYTHV